MTRAGVREYINAIRERYLRGDKKGKGRILDDAVQVTGYHRKALIRVLRRARSVLVSSRRRGRTRQYGPAVGDALRVLWDAADRPCSRRLHPFLPELVRVLRQHREQRQRQREEVKCP